MVEPFFIFAEQFVRFTKDDKETISSVLTFRTTEAKTELVSFDKISDELFFVIKGCVRKYYLKEGEQITIYITTENNLITAFQSFVMGIKSRETIECLEPCELLVLKKPDLELLYKRVPSMNEFIRKVLELALFQFQQAQTTFILDNPEERYLKLLSQQPGLLQRVPQHMLAAYLGITATSLSRIRKRIAGKA